MGKGLTIWTYDWVPEGPRGLVRDLRLRWAAEEAGLRYDVDTVPFEDRQASHLERQPFGQAPFLTDGEITIFESGACLLHLASKSDVLTPRSKRRGRDAPVGGRSAKFDRNGQRSLVVSPTLERG